MATKHRSKRSRGSSKGKVRASWRGMLRFGLVSFHVEAFNDGNLKQARSHFISCMRSVHNLIHYEKVCPIHGKVDNDDIVSGYEYSRGRYVEIEPEELDELRTEHEKALTIDSFVEPEDSIPFITMAGCTI